jgi:hypothetical protein
MWHLCALAALAAEPDPFQDIRADQRERVACTADCLYEQANESLSLMILTKQKRLQLLSNPAYTEAQRFGLISPFCEGQGFPAVDAFEACLKVFKQAEAMWFLKARMALGSNAHAKALVTCDPMQTNCTGGLDMMWAPQQKSQPPLQAQVPLVPTFGQLQTLMKELEGERLNRLSHQVARSGYRGLWQDLEPLKEDFRIFDASSGATTLDHVAYERSHAAWVRHGFESLKRLQEKRLKMSDLQRLIRKGVKEPGLETKIYEGARSEYLDFLVKSFPGLKRKQGAYSGTDSIEVDPLRRKERSFSATYTPSQIAVETRPDKAPKARILPVEKEDEVIRLQF